MTIQTISQIFLIALAAVVLIVFVIKYPFRTVGGVIGGGSGFAVPLLFAQFYVWRGGDPTAVGGVAMLALITIPLGIAIGVGIVTMLKKK
jgi:hypothetical protein